MEWFSNLSKKLREYISFSNENECEDDDIEIIKTCEKENCPKLKDVAKIITRRAKKKKEKK